MIILILFAILLASFVLFKVISKSIAGRKRREAEERARREDALGRQRALLVAKDDGLHEPAYSAEERAFWELKEGMANIVKKHPEDTARLISMLILEDPTSINKESEEFQALLTAYQSIKSGETDKARELLEKTLGSQKADDLINLLTRTVQG
jgi:hypothetical protein